MPVSVNDMPCCELGERQYVFRAPTGHDVPKIRRVLTQQGVRRPLSIEFKLAALAGIDALGESADEPDEAERQKAVVEQWYELLEPTREDDLDEPDFELRAALLAEREAERLAAQAAVIAQYSAIEANLARHWPPYRDLLADRSYWDDISGVEIVRLLLARVDGRELARGGDGMLTHAAFLAIPAGDRGALAAFATRLLSPAETERKN